MGVKSKSMFWGVGTVLLLILLFWAPKTPINVDEFLHNKQARYVVNWYYSFGTDEACLENRPDNLRYYGQSVDNVAAFVNKVFSFENEYLTRHYIGAIMGWLLLVVTGIMALYFTQSYWMAILAMFVLFISPRPFGQVFGNLKDIPFALGYTWAVLGTVKFIRELPLPSFRTSFVLALSIAFANSVRVGALLFFFILGLFTVVWILLYQKQYSFGLLIKKNLKNYVFITAIIVLVGYFGGLLFWPYGLQNPIVHPYKSLLLMQHYAISIRQIFEGNLYWSTHLPWYYILKWMAISIPELVWLSLLVFVFMIFLTRRKKWAEPLSLWILLFCVLFPVLYVILIKSNLYSGWRQLYFIYPTMVVAATIGIQQFWISYHHRIVRGIFVVVLSVLAFFPVKHIVKTFPNQYIYFNEVARMQSNCWSDYEYDYYFQGMKEATDWFFANTNVPEGSIIASNFDLTPYFPANRNLRFKYVHFYEYQTTHWDFGIFSNNYIHPYQLKNNTWMPEGVVKTFYFDKNPYVLVLKWEGDNALIGLKAFQQGLFSKAIFHFEKALETDRNNINTMVYLAQCYLIQSEFDSLELLFQKGLLINPYNEQMKFLKAKMFFQKAEYDQALSIVTDLLKLNSKYQAAFPLLALCYEKTGQADKALKIRKQINNF